MYTQKILQKFIHCKRLTTQELKYLQNAHLIFPTKEIKDFYNTQQIIQDNIKTCVSLYKEMFSSDAIEKALIINPEMLEFFI